MKQDKFLLINTTGDGFWYDMHHTLSNLLLSEITQRIPVIYWGSKSMYSTDESSNAFEQYFFPVSKYGMDELIENISGNGDIEIANRYTDMDGIICRMDETCPYFGMNSVEIYRIMLKKYIRLRPEVKKEINDFYDINMSGKDIIAVHIRGSDKILEVSHLHELNKLYPAKISAYLKVSPDAHIFLMTDCKDILSEYKNIYGDRLINTDCKRVFKNGGGVHFQEYVNNKLKGIEIIRDTWLAAKCDYFIGNGFSNVSRAVCELKDWQTQNVTLLF
ncbi:O-fucosyltransferase family protein [Ruminiclostridium papyrosolvens]|uniref:Alpha-(1,6)-fucosyltransferase N- and catalytic domain-containing protein n=1 Tax=Ruminiclostridium papyrosolvens C7 TaxID=1330534 RepID=U4R703_9FIRM|nr:O-fucosyltransferase family protein [Ruminiclostridium papyrosolvens]EPR13824.1 hypothetical protein L323_02500 [Ruminiclostridium papyrosolvens C7]